MAGRSACIELSEMRRIFDCSKVIGIGFRAGDDGEDGEVGERGEEEEVDESGTGTSLSFSVL